MWARQGHECAWRVTAPDPRNQEESAVHQFRSFHVDAALRWPDLVEGQPGVPDLRGCVRVVDPDHPGSPPAPVQLPLEHEAGHGWRVAPALAKHPDVQPVPGLRGARTLPGGVPDTLRTDLVKIPPGTALRGPLKFVDEECH